MNLEVTRVHIQERPQHTWSYAESGSGPVKLGMHLNSLLF